MENPVLVAVRNEKGFARKLGKELGITGSAVWMWKKVPPRHAFRVAEFMKLPVHMVCPEIVPEPHRRRRVSIGRKQSA